MTRLATLVGYAVLLAGAVGLELAARRRPDGATFGDALAWLLSRRGPIRLLVVLGWLWLGWHLFVRVDWS